MRSATLLLAASFSLIAQRSGAQSLYFPPLIGNAWETTDPASLGWCPDRIDSLYSYLGAHHTKGFIVLKDGRIVLEHYFGSFTQDSIWYWASAGKTLTSTLAGIAQEEGYLNIDSLTSNYLGTGWTIAPPEKEALITVRDQLTMTTGLDDGVPDDHCTIDTCLVYLADAGTRWAYHNGPYTLLDQVIANATGQTFSAYSNSRIRNRIGMGGIWLTDADYNNTYWSKPRSMARYGLLALNHMVWNTDTILHDAAYFTNATTPSQSLNNSYGYLWWLNGQSSFMVPSLQIVFPGPMMPHAPADMFCGLGKNDQLLNVVPSRNMVLVRMGEYAYNTQSVAFQLDDTLWQLMAQLECVLSIPVADHLDHLHVSPNPCDDELQVELPDGCGPATITVLDALGRSVLATSFTNPFDVSALSAGSYLLRAIRGDRILFTRFLKR